MQRHIRSAVALKCGLTLWWRTSRGRHGDHEGDRDAGRQAHPAGTPADRAGAGRQPPLRRDRPTPRPSHLDGHARGDAQRRPHRLPRRSGPPRHRTPRPPAQARPSRGRRRPAQATRTRHPGRGRLRGDVHHRPHGLGSEQDGGPGVDQPVPHRLGQPHRVRTRPAPPGQPGVDLQGDHLPGEPEPRPPRTRRTPSRPLRRRRRLFYQATIASARANDHLVATARQGVALLGAHTPAAARLENIARFLDFISESITRAAEQAREVLRSGPSTATSHMPPGHSDQATIRS